MQELKRRPRTKIIMIAVLSIGLIALFTYFGFGNNDSADQIKTAKAEYFPTADGNWMIQNIVPLTKNLYGVACFSTNFCFGVGDNGTFYKYVTPTANGKWVQQLSFTTKTLRGITCFSPTNCYAVGGDSTVNSGEIWNYDGTNWSLQANNNSSLNAISCTSTNCFAFGQNGLILKQPQFSNNWVADNSGTSNTLNSFSCYSASLCFAVGAGGTILNYDGTNWSNGNSGVTINLSGISCYSQHYCFAVGNNGTLLKYNGTSWSVQTSGTTNNLNSVYCDIFECFVAGDSGTILRFDTVNWTIFPSNTTNNLRSVNCGVVCALVGDVGETQNWDAEKWLRLISGQETQTFPYLANVSCPAVGTCFAVGKAGLIVSFNGQNWSQQNSGITTALDDISCPDITSCFAVGTNGVILHFNGSNWIPQNSGSINELYVVRCPSLTICYAAGKSGTFLRYDGTNWSPLNPGTTFSIAALSCPTVTNCFSVTNNYPNPDFLTYNGSSWASIPITDASNIRGISCSTISDCIIIGSIQSNVRNVFIAKFLHYNGTNITVSYEDITHIYSINQRYNGITCSTTTDCTAVGEFGAILHYDGVNWSPQLTGTFDVLDSISCASPDYCVVVGYFSSLLTKALVVNSSAPANTSGTLAYALANASPYQAINVVLPPGSTINASSQLASAKEGVQINGKCGSNGPAITVNGGGNSGSGLLTLNSKNSVYGLKLTNYNGKLLNLAGTGNKLSCVASVR